MIEKESLFDAVMQEVKSCDLCCTAKSNIDSSKLLQNFIAERPNEHQRYGRVPNRWSDWVTRLEAKIVVVGQDWGSIYWVEKLRGEYEKRIMASNDTPSTWHHMIQNPPYGRSKTDLYVESLFEESARREKLPCLPENFMDRIFFTNSVLCVRQGEAFTGSKNFDSKRSIWNCCFERQFLHRQLAIVRPLVVVALGGLALWGLHQKNYSKTLSSTIEDLRATSKGYIKARYDDIPMIVVPVFHPTARKRDRSSKQQKEDYQYIWRALSDSLNLSGEELVQICFPNEDGRQNEHN